MKPLDASVKSCLEQLATELVQQWGNQTCYRTEQVSEAAEAIGHADDFLIYGHALFCSKPDFDAHYRALSGANYDDLRKAIMNHHWPKKTEMELWTLLMLMNV